jgi:hypothetical protein
VINKDVRSQGGAHWYLSSNSIFWEKSNLASSYRAELLGLCALHLLAWGVVE